jgi:hypothetical protein
MTQENKEIEHMIDNAIGQYYDLETIGTNSALEYVTMRYRDLKQSRLIKYKNAKLINVNGLATGQLHFITEDGHYLLLPWCYVISMIPAKS